MSYRYIVTLCLTILILAALPTCLDAQSWQWANGAGGSGNDLVGGVAVDSAGNTYVVGTFERNIAFNSTTFADGENIGLFLAKYSPVGDLLWATYAGGPGNFHNPSIGITKFGAIFVAGSFSGQVAFGNDLLRSLGGSDIFIVRYDSNGVRQWSRRDGSTGDEIVRGIAVTPASEVVIAGYYSGLSRVDTVTFPNSGGSDFFLAKYEGTGRAIWARRAGGPGSDQARAVGLDNAGNIYIAGSFADSVIVGGTMLRSTGGTDAFVARYTSAGAPFWATSMGGPGNDSALALVADRFGNSYVAGSFTDSAQIGGDLLRSAGLTDAFVAKLDGPGSIRWAREGGGGDSDVANAVAVDSLGAVYITGRYYDSAFFDSTRLDDTSGNGDIFVVKYDGSGSVQWGRTAGGLLLDEGRAIAVDLNHDLRVAGSITDVATFGSNRLRAGDALDLFVARIGPDPTITTGDIVVGPFCPGARFNVPFTFGGIYATGNVFSVQLSDSAGSFENALVIGRLSARQGSIVAATIPADIAPGTRYRVRVVSSEPAVTGQSNQSDITINAVPAPVIAPSGPTTICNGSSVTLDAGPGFRSYRWSNGLTTRTIAASQAGDYTVTVTNTAGCEGTSFAIPVRIIAPEKPTITREAGVLRSSQAVAYRWSLNGTEIAGATGDTFQPTQEGSYTVTITDTTGCTAVSDPFFFSTLGVDREIDGKGLSIYPRPNRGRFTVELGLPHPGDVTTRVIDAAGRTVRQWSERGAELYRREVDIRDLPAGVYFVRVESEGSAWSGKVVKE
jgi:hypothetical protein